jgi:hypothetical protein
MPQVGESQANRIRQGTCPITVVAATDKAKAPLSGCCVRTEAAKQNHKGQQRTSNSKDNYCPTHRYVRGTYILQYPLMSMGLLDLPTPSFYLPLSGGTLLRGVGAKRHCSRKKSLRGMCVIWHT